MGRLDDKVALITGGANGIGRATAEHFVGAGARVAIADVADQVGMTAVEKLGPDARYVHLDVTSESDWDTAIGQIVDDWGHVDVLVNNAGVAEGAPLVDTTLESYRRVTEVNQTGVFLGMRSVIAPMTAAGGGSIVNVSSIDGLIGMNNIVAYVASKWAVRGMTKTAAMELGPAGIRVNSVHPGFIHTDLGARPGVAPEQIHAHVDAYTEARAPLGRAGSPGEIADLVLFLASDESAYCTGSEFVADGGLTAGHPTPGSTA